MTAAEVLGIAAGFTEFVHHDAVRMSDSEGRVAYGGDATLGDPAQNIGLSIGSGKMGQDSLGPDLTPDPARVDMIVGGRLKAYNVVLEKGSGTYGSLDPASNDIGMKVPGATATQAPSAIDFDTEFERLEEVSAAWKSVAPNGTVTFDGVGGGRSATFAGTAPEQNVFTVASEELQTAPALYLKVPTGSTTLINVTGSKYDMTAGPTNTVFIWDSAQGKYVADEHWVNRPPAGSQEYLAVRQSVMWNFPDATEVVKNFTAWPGSVLAPRALLRIGTENTGPGDLNGGYMVSEVTSVLGAQTTYMPFVGTCLPPRTSAPPTTTTQPTTTESPSTTTTETTVPPSTTTSGGTQPATTTPVVNTPGPPRRLADTGPSTPFLLLLGLAFLASGLMAVRLARRRT